MTKHIISSSNAKKRASVLAALRRALDTRSFLEITTPVLLKIKKESPQPKYPFNIGDYEYDLRNSIELLLRTALAETQRVYDIGPAIRFEDQNKIGRSAVEFTLLEFFAVDLSYEELVSLVEEILREIAPNIISPTQYLNVIDWFDEQWKISFDEPDRSKIRTKLEEITGIEETVKLWELIDKVISTHLEPTLKGLVFLTDYPIETICLARRRANASHIAERFEVYLNGIEIGHGFIDATDAEDVRSRMEENGKQFIDQKFLELLQSGSIPPSGGFGLGIERLLAASDEADSDVRRFIHAYQHS